MFATRLFFALLTFVSVITAAHHHHNGFHNVHHRSLEQRSLERRAGSRYVFAHFMIGIVSNRGSAADYDADMKRAKAYGIDAFALNIGTDSFTDNQLAYAYTSAYNNGMKVFLSFDFAYWDRNNPSAVGAKIKQYAGYPAQLVVDGTVFVSSFVGDGLNVAAVKAATGQYTIRFLPNFDPALGTDFSPLDGAFNWMGWPNNGQNRAPSTYSTSSVDAGDQKYISALKGKDYVAPASPWFFTHYGAEVSYSKNWLFPGESLWFDRWTKLLTLGPRYIEIVSWNDFGESHYIGPLSSTHVDDGASKWINDMPHDAWLDMAKPYIAAFKAGATKVDSYITTDQIIYWYRPQLKSADCSATDTCSSSPPDGYGSVSDTIFVVALLTSAGTVRVTSGGSYQDYAVNAGATMITFPMKAGPQQFTLTRNSVKVLDGTSLKNVINTCVCGLYNYNAYVGMLPSPGTPPGLDTNGLSKFSNGLKVSTCLPKTSLGSTTTASTTTSSAMTTTSSKMSTTTSSAVATTSSKTSVTTTSSKSSTTTPSVVTTTSSKPSTTTSTAVVTTSSKPSTTPTITSSAPTASSVCVSGSGSGNYAGLCSFCCNYGYCPPGPCTCNSYGAQNPPPPTTNVNGQPANGLDSSYSGLCSYACSHGYCPSGACRAA